jgi:hypothetical protein
MIPGASYWWPRDLTNPTRGYNFSEDYYEYAKIDVDGVDDLWEAYDHTSADVIIIGDKAYVSAPWSFDEVHFGESMRSPKKESGN